MDNIRELMEKRAASVAAMRSLVDTAEAENRDLTAEEQETYNRHEADVRSLGDRITRLERQSQLENELKGSANGDQNPALRGSGGGSTRDNTDSAEYRSALRRYLFNGSMDSILRVDGHALNSEARDILGLSLTGSGATGGILAPAQLEKQLLEDLASMNVMRRLADVRSSASDVDIPYASTHTTAYRVAEGAAVTASTPAFSKITMKSYKAGALSYVTIEALQDIIIDLEGWIRDDFARAFANLEEADFISGDGDGDPQGILVGGTKGKDAGAATYLTADEIIDLIYSVPAGYRRNGTFIMKDSTAGLLRKLKDNDGQYLWQPSLQAGQPDRLLGYPVEYSDSMDAVAASKKPIVFGDMKQFRILDRKGLWFQRLNEVAATTGQVGFLAFRRYDSKVLHSNAIKWIATAASDPSPASNDSGEGGTT